MKASVDTAPTKAAEKQIWNILQQVTDPEIPVLTIEEIGILRKVSLTGDRVHIQITPTYSGCPAIEHIISDIKTALLQQGYTQVEVELILSPAWTTDWMTPEAKQKLRDYGITPPCKTSDYFDNPTGNAVLEFSAICPQCSSTNTKLISEFGSTACKALWKCNDCLEPFDFFKPI